MSYLVAELKDRARQHYLAYQRAVDGLDCGHALAVVISADASIHAREFDATMDALAAIDPACPPRRLTRENSNA